MIFAAAFFFLLILFLVVLFLAMCVVSSRADDIADQLLADRDPFVPHDEVR